MGKDEKAALKLTIELVPSTSWWKNLRAKIEKEKWDEVRRSTYAKYDYKCGICGSKGRMNCHELWEYNDVSHVQKLKGFIALCDMCHHVKHIGLVGILASEGKLDYDGVVQHFMRVNNCTREKFEKHKNKAFEIWEERSKYKWKLETEEALGNKAQRADMNGQKKLGEFLE